MTTARTLYQKLWDAHLVRAMGADLGLLYIDRHLIHEVTSPQAFQGLKAAGRTVRRRESVLAVPDHNVPTLCALRENIPAGPSRVQLDLLQRYSAENGIRYIPLMDARQGIVHIVGPEQGFTLPGMTVVCGDSHTSTHGAFGCLAFGIGTSEVEHVLATQTLAVRRASSMRVCFNGSLAAGVSAKDMALALIAKIGAGGASGYVIEYAGPAVRELSMEGRMTLCNMSIEAGARAGMIAVDETTLEYLSGKPMAPSGEDWSKAVATWRNLHSDEGARFDRELEIDANTVVPKVTWGTSPDMVADVTGVVPDPAMLDQPSKRSDYLRALDYMGLKPGAPIASIQVDTVFIGSCTNARLEDLRAAAAVVAGKHKADNVKRALVVPGSGLVKQQAEKEGLRAVFEDAGFEWREPGCSMCLGMNGDELAPGERCASTSNRNFEGRQGAGGRTHLVSPAMAAAAAIAGHFVDVRDLMGERA